MPLNFKFELLKDIAEVAKVGNPEEDVGEGKEKDKRFSSKLVIFEQTTRQQAVGNASLALERMDWQLLLN